MADTIGKRIAELRRRKELKQDDIAQSLGVSPQAVSKWENDIACPDITLLPQLARLFGVTTDELLTGEIPDQKTAMILPESERSDISKRMLKVVVDSHRGDKVRVNLPMLLVKTAIEIGITLPEVSGNVDVLNNIDFAQILKLVENGLIGNLVEVESADGDIVHVFVE